MAKLKFKMTCPNCNSVIVTACPAAAVWELCPDCRRHVWDVYDAMMAEVLLDNPVSGIRNLHQSN